MSSVYPACRKRRLIGAVCQNHRMKRLVSCRCLDGHVKEPYEMSMVLGARPLVQLLQSACTSCSVTYMTEISLIVTLSNQFTSPLTCPSKHRHRANLFTVPRDRPILVAFYDTHGDTVDTFSIYPWVPTMAYLLGG